jgi:hypothetical protein
VGEEAQPIKLVATPLEAIRTAKQFLYWAWFLHEAVERGAIAPETFTNEITEGTTTLRWPPENRTPAALARWSWNTVLAAMSISAIAADRALDDTFGPKPHPAGALSDQDATRVVLYMLRCAYAHDPLNPRWECQGPYGGVFRINALGFEFDTRALNGQPWNIEHVGGPLGYFKLSAHCQELVAAAESGPASA